MKSPCKGQCLLDFNDVCAGCKRTKTEIINWRDYNDEERLEIIKSLKHRNNEWNGRTL